ncbi:MAG: pesticin [Acidobacteriia bacterium]|nr:pesticin [Terriglobia bacterium]
MKPAPVTVRKYGNRRLYDTSASRYVNLDDIAALIRQGKEVQVVDAKSGKDLTRVALAQIITEDAKARPTGLPLDLLRQLIVVSDQVGREFIMWYLKSAFDAYQAVQGTIRNRFTEVQSAMLSPVELVRRFLGGRPLSPQSPQPGSELNVLRQRLAELEAGVARTAPAKRRRRRKPKRPHFSRKAPGSRVSGSSRSSSWAAPPGTPRGAAF